jgi:hypothetical protein
MREKVLPKYFNLEDINTLCSISELAWINYDVLRNIWGPIIFLINLGIVVRICHNNRKHKTNENKDILRLAVAFMINVFSIIM